MDTISLGGCCGTDELAMECSSMAGCDHNACICKSSPKNEQNHSDSSCACCEMCAHGGCAMGMLTAIIDFNPGNLNLKSQARFLTVYIELDEPAT